MPLAFVPIPHCARFQLIFTQQGQRVENVYHGVAATDFDTAMLLEAASDFATMLTSQWPITASQEVQPVLFIGTALHAEHAPGIESDFSGLAHGSDVAQALPMNATIVVSWHSGVRGRSFNGRTYHVGLTAAMVTDSTIDPTMKALLMTAYGRIRINLSGHGIQQAIASYWEHGVRRTTGIATAVLTQTIDDTTDSQRRRLPGRGR